VEAVVKLSRVLSFVLLLFFASAAWAQKVDVDWNRNTDFSKFKTYAWIESKHPGKGLWNQRIIDGVDAKLAKAGLKKVDASANPDLEVVYNAGVKEHTVVEGYDYYYHPWGWYGPRPWFGPRPAYTDSYQEKEATLIVDLVDNSDKEMVWRGTARDTLADSSERNVKTFNKAMDKMFKSFPPKKK
jgi:hypothetical protein